MAVSKEVLLFTALGSSSSSVAQLAVSKLDGGSGGGGGEGVQLGSEVSPSINKSFRSGSRLQHLVMWRRESQYLSMAAVAVAPPATSNGFDSLPGSLMP